MKNFRVQIATWAIMQTSLLMSEDNAESIEQSILDKIGKNEV